MSQTHSQCPKLTATAQNTQPMPQKHSQCPKHTANAPNSQPMRQTHSQCFKHPTNAQKFPTYAPNLESMAQTPYQFSKLKVTPNSIRNKIFQQPRKTQSFTQKSYIKSQLITRITWFKSTHHVSNTNLPMSQKGNVTCPHLDALKEH